MLSKLRPRLTFSNVVSLLALFVALSGGAYAAATINSADIVDDSVRSEDIKDSGLRGMDIRNGTLGSSDIADGSLGGTDIANDSLTSRDIESLADSRGIVKLSAGDTVTLLQKGPISLVASCKRDASDTAAPDTLRADVVAQSTEADTLADFGAGQTGLINDAQQLGITADGDSPGEWSGRPYLVAAPGGQTVAGHVLAGVYAFGADCAAVATGEGGHGIRRALP